MLGGGVNFVKHELVRDRGPPPPPTPLQFPQSTFDPGQARPYTSREIYQLFTTIHKTRPKLDPLQALSVQSIEVGLEQLLPEGYLPDASWNQDPSVANHVVLAPVDRTPSATLGNGTAAPGHDAWYKSAKELLHDNDDVFKYLRGTLQSSPDRPKLRVAMFRKFWDHLRELSMYWDTRNEKYEDVSGEAATLASAPAPDAMDIDKTSAANQPTEETKNGKAKQTYTGNRIGTGREMPPVYREDVICAFVETVAMAFHCRIERPPIAPKLKMQNILIPVPQAGIVYRCPNDRLKARRGILEGPLLAVQCNHNTAFRRQEEATVKEKEPDDKGQDEAISLLREVGSMLNLAQKRAREGQEEPIPGEEQWWVTKPRWGGGSGGAVPSKEVPNGHAPDDDDDDPEGSNKGVKRASKGAKPLTAAAKRAKRLYAMENWKKLNPGPRRWDRGVVHLQIGKDQGATGDDIYLVSGLNHHLSILHVRVHSEYIQHLNGEPSPDDFVPSSQQWYELNIKRSRWFDLFVAEDRIEAMRGVWGVLAYLMRGEKGDDDGNGDHKGKNKEEGKSKGIDKAETKVGNKEVVMELGGQYNGKGGDKKEGT